MAFVRFVNGGHYILQRSKRNKKGRVGKNELVKRVCLAKATSKGEEGYIMIDRTQIVLPKSFIGRKISLRVLLEDGKTPPRYHVLVPCKGPAQLPNWMTEHVK